MKKFVFVVLFLSSVCAIAQTQFAKGSYYDLKGKRTEGYITLPKGRYYSYTASNFSDDTNSYIDYRKDTVDKPIRIKAWKLKSFTIGVDSFAVLQHFKIAGFDGVVDVPIGFCRVIVDDGKVLLYVNSLSEKVAPVQRPGVYGPLIANETVSYLLQQKGSEKITVVPMEIELFVDNMSHYFQISEEIARRIRAREYSYNSIEKLVRDFNVWYANRNVVNGH